MGKFIGKRIKELEDIIVKLDKEKNALIAENRKYKKAMKIADLQYLGCGGNLKPTEVVSEMRKILQHALSE